MKNLLKFIAGLALFAALFSVHGYGQANIALGSQVSGGSIAAAPAGTTPVGTTGIDSPQVAYGSAPNTIKGSSQFTFIESDSLRLSNAVTNGFQLHNTSDQTTNYERLGIYWLSNVAVISADKGGSGNIRSLRLASDGTSRSYVEINGSGATRFSYTQASSPVAGNTINFTASAANVLTSGTTNYFAIAPSYNQASGNAANTDLLVNRTQTAVGSGAQLLADFQVGSVSKFSIDNSGNAKGTDGAQIGWGTGTTSLVGNSSTSNLQLRTGGNTALTIDSSQNVTFAGAVIGANSQALSGAGAIDVTHLNSFYTSTGVAQALTLANGTAGQLKHIVHTVDGGSGILTPTTKIGFSTITFTNVGDSVSLLYTTTGWAVTGSYGAVIAP